MTLTLIADHSFFVLNKKPMAVCPFCETSANWPDDIHAVYTKRAVDVTPSNVRIGVTGVTELGDWNAHDNGFLSRVRLTGATYGQDESCRDRVRRSCDSGSFFAVRTGADAGPRQFARGSSAV